MGKQRTLFPSGLNRRLFKLLTEHTERADDKSFADLLRLAESHLERVGEAHRENSHVNLSLAEAICGVIRAVVADWAELPAAAEPWMRGAISYFAEHCDSQPDFGSPIGFEDDVEVLNACLRLAGHDELCLKPEEYDGA